MTKESVVASPKDEIIDGIIVNIEKGLLSEFVPEKYHADFDNLAQETLKIYYQVKFGDKIITGSDRFPYYSEPMANSNLGRFLDKYGELKPEVKVKVIFDGKGFSKIKLD